MLSKKDDVPERAIVPSVSVRSSALSPIPVSKISIVFFFSFTFIRISSASEFKIAWSVCPRNLRLCIASEALDSSSRKKISRSEYNELITMLRILPVSASKLWV